MNPYGVKNVYNYETPYYWSSTRCGHIEPRGYDDSHATEWNYLIIKEDRICSRCSREARAT